MLPGYRVSEGGENGILFYKKGENWKERERIFKFSLKQTSCERVF